MLNRLGMAFVMSLTAFGLIAAQGCKPGGAGDVVRPPDPKARERYDAKCNPAEVDRATPLVIDWESHERGDLEEAMHDGIAVVHYDCEKLYALPRCSVKGTYGYMSFEPKEDILQLRDATEIHANLPLFSARVGGETAQSTALDLALVMVGKRRTTMTEVSPQMMDGSCAGATHFVRGVYVGASAFRTAAAGRASTRAEIFGAGAGGGVESSRTMHRRDGDPDRCFAKSDGAQAPSGCGSIVRLELYAVQRSVAASTPRLEVEALACPKGSVPVNGKCAAPQSVRAYECKPEDPEECRAQCDRGDLRSCAHLAFAIHYGNSGAAEPLTRARALYEKACDGGVLDACTGLGALLVRGEAGFEPDSARAMALHARACDGGIPRGCNNLAVGMMFGLGVPVDPRRAATLFRRACDGGLAAACGNLAKRYADGRGVEKSEAQAIALFKKSCFEGAPDTCEVYGSYFLEGKVVPADAKEAERAFKAGFDALNRACLAGNGSSCGELSVYYWNGRGRAKDLKQAIEASAKGCRLGAVTACEELAWMLLVEPDAAANGAQLAHLLGEQCRHKAGCASTGLLLRDAKASWKDVSAGNTFLETGCKAGEPLACVYLAETYARGIGVTADPSRAATLEAQACEKYQHGPSCTTLGARHERGPGVPPNRAQALRYYLRGCDAGDARGCEAAARLKANP